MAPHTRYLTCDLDVVSLEPLSQLLARFERSGDGPSFDTAATHGEDGRWYGQVFSFAESDEPTEHVEALLDVIEALEGEELALWTRAEARVFDIGFEASPETACFQRSLRPELLARVAAAGAALRITIYPFDEGDE